jgi:uncharacterized membrane protein YdjX (TVP38/TMEM64 family)
MIVSRQKIILILGIVFFISMSYGIATIPAETIVNFVGSEHALFLMFALGAIGGLTTFSGIPYHVILMSFAAGGINPLALGIVTALGVMIGDSTMFLFSRQAGHLIAPNLRARLATVAEWFARHPRLLTPSLILYGAVSPLSNDFIVASLALLKYQYHKIIIPLTIGNICFNTALAYLGYFAYDSLMGLW